jgi:hypothetical protein
MSIQDPALDYRFLDYYYFSYLSDMGSEGTLVGRWVLVWGHGPQKYRQSSMITVAGTIDANIALNMPQGVSGITPATWDDLTDDEKNSSLNTLTTQLLF